MHPFEKQMLTVVRQKAIGTDTSYEPPLRIGFGISDKTVGDVANATMGRTILVPGAGPNPTHYHAKNDVCWYILVPRSDRHDDPAAAKFSPRGTRQAHGRHIDIPPRGVTSFGREVLLEFKAGTSAQY